MTKHYHSSQTYLQIKEKLQLVTEYKEENQKIKKTVKK